MNVGLAMPFDACVDELFDRSLDSKHSVQCSLSAWLDGTVDGALCTLCNPGLHNFQIIMPNY